MEKLVTLKTKSLTLASCSLVCILLLFGGETLAGESAHGHGGEKSHGEKPHAGKAHKGKKKSKKGHHFTAHWAQSLSAEQKKEVDLMHLKLDQDLLLLKAKLNVVQTELNLLTAKNQADKKEIYKKIDDYMAIQSKIMLHRYDHLLEMRGVLNADQRISYDMGILKRSGVK